MYRISRFVVRCFTSFGFNPWVFYNAVKAIPSFASNYVKVRRQLRYQTDFKLGSSYPVLGEQFYESGVMKGHYFHQDIYVARKIFESNPLRHVDIGSRTDGFIAHVCVFRKVEVFDIRAQQSKIENVEFRQCDLMQLPVDLIGYTDSLSALHSIEHFGLGRYGDPIDLNGHVKAINNIYHILKPGGKFYFSTPIGPQRIEYNAHRVFSIAYLLQIFSDKFRVDHFSFVDDKGDLHANAELTDENIRNNFKCMYGCGIFELTKKQRDV